MYIYIYIYIYIRPGAPRAAEGSGPGGVREEGVPDHDEAQGPREDRIYVCVYIYIYMHMYLYIAIYI